MKPMTRECRLCSSMPHLKNFLAHSSPDHSCSADVTNPAAAVQRPRLSPGIAGVQPLAQSRAMSPQSLPGARAFYPTCSRQA